VGCEVDFLWRAEGIAVEVDGYRYHSARSRFENDRRRAAHLAAHGIQVIPVTWRQIADEGTATAVQLGRALLRAGRP
jgi:very-short-patch-repair endonuclease